MTDRADDYLFQHRIHYGDRNAKLQGTPLHTKLSSRTIDEESQNLETAITLIDISVSMGRITQENAQRISRRTVSTLSLLTYMRTFHAAKTIGDIASALERHEVTAEVVSVWLDENVLANPYGFAYSAEQGGYTIPLDRRTTELLKPNDYGNDSI